MAKNQNTSVSLGAHFTDFISGQVKEGRYNTASDVVRAGLRLLEEHEDQRRALRQALDEGLDSGLSGPFDYNAFLDRMRAKHGPME